MSVELRPLGVTCNIGCEYCYQQPQRDAGNLAGHYDLDAMKGAVEREGGPFTLFGGEPLLVPIADLEALWQWGHRRFGGSGIQTNGTLLTDAHIELFRKYRVHVGISIDGPGELNDVRRAGSIERTRQSTARTEDAIARLCRAGLPPSVIVTLHRTNASSERLPRLLAWVEGLKALGVTSLRLHLLEVEQPDIRRRYALTDDENIAALMSFAAAEERLLPLSLDVFDEMRRLLLGSDEQVSCVWRACDPYTTSAVRGVEGFGQRSNCGRTNKDGVDFVKADRAGSERYLALYLTPQEHGGCRGCRFFLMCKGQCPGTAIDGDWRNRTEHCRVWKEVFTRIEQALIEGRQTPLSQHPARPQIERRFLAHWTAGDNPTIASVLRSSHRPSALGQRPSPRPFRFAQGVPSAVEGRSGPSHANAMSVAPLAGASARPFPPKAGHLPEFTRLAWVSGRARAVWEPRVARITRAWLEIERATVRAGLRRCALQHVPVAELPSLTARLAGDGLCALPVAHEPERSGFRVAIGDTAAVVDLQSRWATGDHVAIGRLLGFPECCTAFFQRVWVEERATDTTWAMAHAAGGARIAEVEGPPQANILLRWLGVRAVSHLPCAFDCTATIQLADDMLRIATTAGFAQEVEWILEMLSWPCEWSALHGITEIKTPVVKIVASTDATVHRHVVRRAGTRSPADAARGLVFPFRAPRAAAAAAARPTWYFTDNGFASARAMNAAHQPIVDLVLQHFDGRAGRVLDLGCGNGALLAALTRRHSGLTPLGIDRDPLKIAHAATLFPDGAARFTAGDIFDAPDALSDQHFELALLMPGRLLETEPDRAARLRRWLLSTGGRILVYAYDDWNVRFGGVWPISTTAGFSPPAGARPGATCGLL